MAAPPALRLAVFLALVAPAPLLGASLADPSYTKPSYGCADYTPLDRGAGNIVEFRCQDGRCIEIEGRCNGVRNCEDGSDEAPELCPTTTPAATEAPTTTKEAATTPAAAAAPKTGAKEEKEEKEEKKDAKATPEAKAVAAMEKKAKSSAEEQAEANAVAEAKAREQVLAASEATIEATAPPCRTAVSGEVCYKKVMWAKFQGVKEHPDWYHGLTASSSFEAFQAALHLGHYGHCPVPCHFEMPTTRTSTVTQTSTTTTTLSPKAQENLTLSCSGPGVFMPMDMPGTSMSIVENITACQVKCAKTEGCVHFSFYKPLRNCHLQNKYAKLVRNNPSFLSGPPACVVGNQSKDDDESEMEFRKLFLNLRRQRQAGARLPLAATLAFGAAVCGVAAALGLAWRRGRGSQVATPESGELYATLKHASSENQLHQEGEILE